MAVVNIVLHFSAMHLGVPEASSGLLHIPAAAAVVVVVGKPGIGTKLWRCWSSMSGTAQTVIAQTRWRTGSMRDTVLIPQADPPADAAATGHRSLLPVATEVVAMWAGEMAMEMAIPLTVAVVYAIAIGLYNKRHLSISMALPCREPRKFEKKSLRYEICEV